MKNGFSKIIKKAMLALMGATMLVTSSGVTTASAAVKSDKILEQGEGDILDFENAKDIFQYSKSDIGRATLLAEAATGLNQENEKDPVTLENALRSIESLVDVRGFGSQNPEDYADTLKDVKGKHMERWSGDEQVLVARMIRLGIIDLNDVVDLNKNLTAIDAAKINIGMISSNICNEAGIINAYTNKYGKTNGIIKLAAELQLEVGSGMATMEGFTKSLADAMQKAVVISKDENGQYKIQQDCGLSIMMDIEDQVDIAQGVGIIESKKTLSGGDTKFVVTNSDGNHVTVYFDGKASDELGKGDVVAYDLDAENYANEDSMKQLGDVLLGVNVTNKNMEISKRSFAIAVDAIDSMMREGDVIPNVQINDTNEYVIRKEVAKGLFDLDEQGNFDPLATINYEQAYTAMGRTAGLGLVELEEGGPNGTHLVSGPEITLPKDVNPNKKLTTSEAADVLNIWMNEEETYIYDNDLKQFVPSGKTLGQVFIKGIDKTEEEAIEQLLVEQE